jgi:hypothetical protein
VFRCIATGSTAVTDWEAGLTEFSLVTGTGAVVLQNSPTLQGALNLVGGTTANALLATALTTGTLTIGSTTQTGLTTIGQSTLSSTIGLAAGVTASGNTNTINIGAAGAAGSTTAITIGSTTGTSTTTLNGITNGAFNGTVGATTASTGAFTTLSASGTIKTADGQVIGWGNGNVGFIGSAASNYLRTYINSSLIGEFSFTGLAVTGALSSTGSIFAGTADSDSQGRFGAKFAGSATLNGLSLIETATFSGAGYAVFKKSDGTTIGSITRVTTTDAVVYNTTSDGRLKENLRDFTDSGRLIDSLKPRVFDWKNSDENGKNVIGFIAQEEHAADPIFAHIGAVSVGDEDPETITKQWQRSDSALIPILVAELKALRQRVAALESN